MVFDPERIEDSRLAAIRTAVARTLASLEAK